MSRMHSGSTQSSDVPCSAGRLLACAFRTAPRRKRRSLHGPRAQHRPAHDLQQRGHHPGPRDPHGDVQEGRQPLQFSWANTLIDPSSVELQFLTQADKLEVVDTTFPHAKPQMLYWNVQSEIDGEAKIQITYFTSGITWSADYICIADKDEKQMGFDGFVRVHNNSGEEYENAQVRLVVGTINLVEKIAQLAQIPMAEVAKLDRRRAKIYRFKAAKDVADAANGPQRRSRACRGRQPRRRRSSRKASASTSSTRSKGPRRSTTAGASGCGLRGAECRSRSNIAIARRNTASSSCGCTCSRTTRNRSSAPRRCPTASFGSSATTAATACRILTQQAVKYIPIGDKIELNLGVDPEVIFELIKLRVFRSDLILQINGTNEFRKIGGDGAFKEENATLVGWDGSRDLQPADSQLHRQGHQRRSPPHAPRPHPFQKPAGAEAPRLSDRGIQIDGRRRQESGSAV